ncbi:hypothetical protein [Mucilaginibacter arboris]|uniref:Uncharacterized protein n=1 Tax=Mucilaginibacter arboris TaxID=2682090 RepID=A0A7K1SXR0_9SPHI|nr:hypothetical protein [Mucilaginibacter arboris]MVN22115.1 hypothetical protein [Mucilaginibacter arboris]
MSVEIEPKFLKVISKLPHYFDPTRSESVPEGLIGAEIINFGTTEEPELFEGGGLVIDYKKTGSNDIWRLILSFNDSGMWIEFNGIKA